MNSVSDRTAQFLTVTAALALALLPGPALGVDLDGGTETFPFPEDISDMRATITLTNDVKDVICDFRLVVAGDAPPFNIASANITDNNQAGENWDVDDDNSTSLEAGENDDSPPAAAARVRIEERGRNHCIGRGRTVSLDLTFDQNPRRGDELKIKPTSAAGGIIFASLLPARFVFDDDFGIPAGFATVVNDSGRALSSVFVDTDPGVNLEWFASPSHGGLLAGREFDFESPVAEGTEFKVEFMLSGYNPSAKLTTVGLRPPKQRSHAVALAVTLFVALILAWAWRGNRHTRPDSS